MAKHPEDQELRDVVAAETSRGRKQPRKVLSIERRRLFQQAEEMLRDSNCDLRTYLEVIREIEPQEDSPEFVRAVKLWYDSRGKP
jgi:hypothetical protein